MEISRKAKPKYETPSSYIPQWFLHEIFFKLPSKSVFRFKCISKQVLALISDPSFIRDYISRASSQPLPSTLLNRYAFIAQADKPCEEEERFDHFERKSTPCISKLFVTPPSSVKSSCIVLSISNGLCLCYWDFDKSYSIFNPITKQSIVLPETTRYGMEEVSVMAFQAHVDQVGVVSYKVAQLLFELGAPRTDLMVEELSSKTYKWTSFRAQFAEPILGHDLTHPFSFKGNFHWTDVFSLHGSGCIISYDPLHIINCPITPDMIWCGEIVSAEGEHTIRCIEEDYYSNQQGFGFINIWRLTNYEKGLWKLDHKFALSDVLLPYADNKILTCSLVHNIALNPREPDLLYFWGKSWGESAEEEEEELEWMLVSFNMRSRKTRVSDTVPRKSDYGGISTSFLDTPFVLPPWPVIIPHLSPKLTCQTS